MQTFRIATLSRPAASWARRPTTPRLAQLRVPAGRVPAAAVRRVSGTAAAAAVQVEPGERAIRIASSAVKPVDLPNFWLRDNCRCTSCVNQDTSQRNFDTFEIPSDIRAANATADDKGLNVVWGDNHKSHYPWDFLNFYRTHDHRAPEEVEFHYWGSSIEKNPPTVDYAAVMDTSSEKGIGKLTDLIRRYGFAFVDNTPAKDPNDTKLLLERIAFIRETHYGGFYDFIPDLAMADTAYTNLALPAHTDTTYFTDPAGLQAFHLLSHFAPPGKPAPKPEDGPLGGASLLVDAFYAAQMLWKEDPEAFDVLTRVRLPWHASGNQGITIAPDRRYPVLELVDDHDAETVGRLEPGKRLHRVRWNNDDRGVVPLAEDSGVSPDTWYAAARKWSAILRRADMEFWTQLGPGRTLIFDNWRVMHGRSAFEGVRRICGGYVCRDDFISRWRNTNYPREEVLKHVVG